ncbi:MAG: hypothetical protein WDZ75_00785 [Candidatus Paceibacterota bacterium]
MNEEDDFEQRRDNFNKRLESMSAEEMAERQEEEYQKNSRDFEKLKQTLAQGQCMYCGNELTHFSKSKPCYHWLLRKCKGFRNKHLRLLGEMRGFHEIESYVRWVANTERSITNINDLADERNPNKIIELTVKYQNIEWSFSCSQNDFSGHSGGEHSRKPHYHFQMKQDGQIFIKYRDHHMPFNDYDEFAFAVERGDFPRLGHKKIEGAGMQALFDHMTPEELLMGMKNANENSLAQQLRVQTLVEADPGTTISGDQVADLMEESKKTGVPMARLIKENVKNVSATTYITPGPAVPEIAERKPRSRKKR